MRTFIKLYTPFICALVAIIHGVLYLSGYNGKIFKCENCGIEIDRDLNAAINIKRMGVDILYNRTQRDEVANPVEASKIEW